MHIKEEMKKDNLLRQYMVCASKEHIFFKYYSYSAIFVLKLQLWIWGITIIWGFEVGAVEEDKLSLTSGK